MKLLEDHPVADDVLDAVGHHRAGHAQKVSAVAGVAQGGEGFRRGRGPAGIHSVGQFDRHLGRLFASHHTYPYTLIQNSVLACG